MFNNLNHVLNTKDKFSCELFARGIDGSPDAVG
jgi:hypothetical protein